MTVRKPHAKCWTVQYGKIMLNSVLYVSIQSVLISLDYGIYAGVIQHFNQIEYFVCIVITP